MIKRFILGTFLSFCLFIPFFTATNVTSIAANAAVAEEEIEPYSTQYTWYYKVENGVKYMRLWDNKHYCWITNWIPVE